LDRSAFSTLKEGASLSEVLSLMGAPDELTMWRVRTEKLVLHYADAGLFLMSVEQGVPPRYIAMQVHPELVPVRATYKGQNFGFAQILGSVHGRPLVQYFKSERQRIVADMDAMYVLGRLLELPPAEHRYDVAMFEIALKELWRSRDTRSKEWIRQVAELAGESDAKDQATKYTLAIDSLAARRLEQQANEQQEKEGSKEEGTDDKP